MQRGFPHMLSWHVLLVFSVVYFILAAYTSGVSVPAGLIVPMLLIGGSFGRAFGLLGIVEKRYMCSALSDLEAAAASGELGMSMADLGVPGSDESMRRMLEATDGVGDPGDWMYTNTCLLRRTFLAASYLASVLEFPVVIEGDGFSFAGAGTSGLLSTDGLDATAGCQILACTRSSAWQPSSPAPVASR